MPGTGPGWGNASRDHSGWGKRQPGPLRRADDPRPPGPTCQPGPLRIGEKPAGTTQTHGNHDHCVDQRAGCLWQEVTIIP